MLLVRNTPQKKLIFEIVNGSHEHLNAYQIYELALMKIPNISLGTVYRNLNFLFEKNKIRRLKMDDGTYRFDRNTRHGHFICNRCNRIIDVYDNRFDNISSIDENEVIDYEISFNGICRECLGKEGIK